MTAMLPERPPWWRLRVPLGPLALAYLLIVLVIAFGFRAQHQNDVDRCETQRENRIVLRQLVTLADDGEGLRLTSVPGFDGLDPATQTYLSTLEALSRPEVGPDGRPPQSRFVREALALLTVPECEER